MTALEAACRVVDAALGDTPDEMAMLAHAKVRGLMVGYDARWSGADWSLVSKEETIIQPIVNPATSRTSRTFRQGGKHDGHIAGFGKRLLLEHKTCSEDIADPNATYWSRLTIDSQLSTYMLQSWQAGERLDGVLYDVIRKPEIRPKKLTKDQVREIDHVGTYMGFVVPERYRALAKAGNLERETYALYELRVARACLDDPARYFQRRDISRLDQELLEHAYETWEIADEIRRARLSDRLPYRNSNACMNYGRPCAFLGLCSGHDTPDSDRWTREEQVHPELDGLEGDTRDILTNSRMKTFQTCRRQHHFKYELGLRRVDETEGEALYLGTVMHQALEAWWSHNHGDEHADATAVTGIASADACASS